MKYGVDLVVVYMCDQNGGDGGIFERVESGEATQPTRRPTAEDKQTPEASTSGNNLQAAKSAVPPQRDPHVVPLKKVDINPPLVPVDGAPAPHRRTWLNNEELLGSFPVVRVLGFGVVVPPQGMIEFDDAATQLQLWLDGAREDSKSRPLIFMGHGFGNIVIQTLFSEKHLGSNPDAGAMLKCTTAIALCAPPFQGSLDLINWTVQTLIPKSSIPIASTFAGLNPPSNLLQDCWEKFMQWTKASRFLTIVALLEKQAPVVGKEASFAKSFFDPDEVLLTSNPVGTICQISRADDPRFRFLSEKFAGPIRYSQLLLAVANGDKDFVIQALTNKFHTNYAGRDGKSPLHVAVEKSKYDIVSLLLASDGIDVNFRDEDGKTALYYAVDQNEFEMVNKLLTAGANPDLENDEGVSARTLARSKLTRIQALLEAPPLIEGPNLEKQIITKGTPPPGPNGLAACSGTEIICTKVFIAKDREFDTFRQEIVKSVESLIYSDSNIDKIFDRGSPKQELDNSDTLKPSDQSIGDAMCRWYHIPMNNMAWVQVC